MSDDQHRATRRIMNAIGEDSRIPLFNVAEGDLYVLLGFPIAGLLIGGATGIDVVVFPLVLCGLVCGTAVVVATPSHLSATTWLGTMYRYYCKRPRVTYNVPANLSPDARTEATTACDGGLIDYTPFTPDERTQDLTHIERAWPGTGAVQRQDGAMEGFVELDPGNMDFAMSGDWAALQSVGESFANNELDFRLTVHTTTRPFPVDRLVTQIDDRLDDEDGPDDSTFRALLEEYRAARPADIEGTQKLHYYLGVEIAPYEVYERHSEERTPAEKLTTIPLLGLLFTPFVTRRERLTEAELRGRLLDRLDDRLRTVETELVSTADGWSARRLSTAEVFGIAVEFWNGTECAEGRAATMARDNRVVDHEEREATNV